MKDSPMTEFKYPKTKHKIIIEPDGKYFHAFVPALSGCHTFGKTKEEANKNIRQAIQAYTESLYLPFHNSLRPEK